MNFNKILYIFGLVFFVHQEVFDSSMENHLKAHTDK
jgi:hypothetical protein